MLQDTITGISQRLNELFGDEYEIYTGKVEPDINRPYFLINMLKVTQEQKLGNCYYRKQPFCLQYFPKENNNSIEIVRVSERLLDGLQYIKVSEDLVRGTDMSAEEQEGVLKFYVNYNMFLCKPEAEAESMEQVQVGTKMKGGD